MYVVYDFMLVSACCIIAHLQTAKEATSIFPLTDNQKFDAKTFRDDAPVTPGWWLEQPVVVQGRVHAQTLARFSDQQPFDEIFAIRRHEGRYRESQGILEFKDLGECSFVRVFFRGTALGPRL